MPELPEVETTCRGIAPHIQGHTITAVQVRNGRLRWPVADNLAQLLIGQSVVSVTRRGKYLLLSIPTGTLLVHLGMSGSLRIVPLALAPDKHDHIDLVFNAETVLRYNDPRRFGAMVWTGQPVETHPLLKDLGPEPLLADFNGALLYQLARQRKVPVKSFIMDSHVVVGVGNIYANEALFMAGILPSRQAGTVALVQYEKLADCIREVLGRAIVQGGTTLRNFVNESGKPGYFKQQLKVYGRAKLPCVICAQPLAELRIANRATVFCQNCQH
ncbi:MAG: bifunctional DNA-formamidopyrimidine glycosylase/DNA-(apurinic or apyrimidinic site) lyase [Methylovulum sp.]|nr:bifunctional DNA-formamidopyrimidine glycosylase/DNA-(apurinic or apyrimidinic site) lyase [Methylovulum sp.]